MDLLDLCSQEHSNSQTGQRSEQRCPSHRAPLGRMKAIYELLLEEKYPNSLTLAADLEISPATVKRDIEFLRDRWGLPIAYDSRRYGYYLTRQVSQPRNGSLSQAELFALRVAHKALLQYRPATLQSSLTRAVDKLTSQFQGDSHGWCEQAEGMFSFRPFGTEDIDERSFDLLTRAIASRRTISFEYRKPGQKTRQLRRVHPYHIMAFENRWYLLANDPGCVQLRKFVVGRMRKIRLLREESFERPTDFDPEQYLDGSLGVMSGTEDYEIVIEMDAWLTDVLRGRCWHRSQVWTELPDGSSQLRLRLNSLEEIEHWVLGWGCHATVLRPAALAQRIAKAAQGLLEKYLWVTQA